MAIEKKRRVGFAYGFLAAVLAAVKAVADATVFWPLSALWAQLRGFQRFQLVGGCVLAVIMLVLFFVFARAKSDAPGTA